MLSPKNREAKYKCKSGCTEANLCAPCCNYRKSFLPGKNVTWGVCIRAYPIVRIEDDGVVVDLGETSVVESKIFFEHHEFLQVTAAIPGKTYAYGKAAIPITSNIRKS